MGSNISIGLVYRNQKTDIITELKNVTEFLLNKHGKINSVQVSEDKEGEKWIKRVISNNEDINSYYEELSKYFYGSIKMKVDLLKHDDLNLVLRVEKEEDGFGFLIDFNESEILSDYSLEELDLITNAIISLMESLRKISIFDYGFCDHEAEVEYFSDKELLEEEVYSVVYLPYDMPFNGTAKIIRNKWHIDGVTARLS
ncbi:Imm64 family immunity protein [Brevibacillus laterosporus]|uniref:Imm64 family immunity protein n=1 Tax=Brevibacillus laterosporus TaxID=1465 RepID=UPI0018CF62C6|nr:Imm64 family immunity protein [Brevibacillus laterosporus]MBG9788849.1 hypothetical protein [Brevibacillus laterosporus]